MPVTYAVRGSLLRLDLLGDYEPEDAIRALHEGLADPACPDPVCLLVDVSRSTSLETRSPNQIRRLVESLAPHAERIGKRCAVLAIRDVHFGLSRMGAVFSGEGGVESAVFREERAALDWLGVRDRGEPPADDGRAG